MANFLSDAFKKLDALNEDTFDLTHDGIEELKDFTYSPLGPNTK